MFHTLQKLRLAKPLTAVLLLSATYIAPLQANAAVVPGASIAKQGQYTVKSSLAEWAGHDKQTLDWRNPVATIRFDAPKGDWSDGVTLFLAGTPDDVHGGTPLMVSFNGGKAVPINSNGHRFDAEIKLSNLNMRPSNNKIDITYQKPADADCLSTDHGSWTLDLDRSKLLIKARPKSRNLQIGEFEPRLKNKLSAPKSIAIIAKGENQAAFEALGAQGIGIRMDTMPTFKTAAQSADLKVYMGTRRALGSTLSQKTLSERKGPSIIMTDGRPMGLIITGDTEAEVLSAARNFARYHLPTSSRSSINSNQLDMQTQFTLDALAVSGTKRLSEMGNTYFDTQYRPVAVNLGFNVSETEGTSGQLFLKLSKNASVANSSRVNVTLNGKALGYTKMDKAKKTVGFNVPAGALKASHNEISILPELDAAIAGCPAYGYEPGIGIEQASKLVIKTPSSRVSLSRFAASGAPFSNDYGQDTTVLIGESVQERIAAQALLAKIAQSSGTGWSNANFTTNVDTAKRAGNHVLVLSKSGENTAAFAGAPRAFADAVRGIVDPKLTAVTVDFASNNAEDTMRQYADLSATQRKSLQHGGMATLYSSPDVNGKIVGIISANSANEYKYAAKTLVQNGHWNKISGSVTRWDKSRVVLAQASNSRLSLPATSTGASGSSATNMVGSLIGSVKGFAASTLTNGRSWASNLSQRTIPTRTQTAVAPQKAAAIVPAAAIAPKAVAIAPASQTLRPKASIVTPKAKSLDLRGRSNLSLSEKIKLVQSRPVHNVSFMSKVASTLDMSTFSFDYFMKNLSVKTNALRNKIINTTKNNVSTPQISAKNQSIFGNDKILMMLLIGVFGILMMGFAAPSSSNKNVR